MLVVLRAHNEERTVGSAVTVLIEAGHAVVVVAAACTDHTEALAAAAGARIVRCEFGLGRTTATAFSAAAGEPFVLVDADVSEVDAAAVEVLGAAADAGFCGRAVTDLPGRSSRLLPELADLVGAELPALVPQARTPLCSSRPARFADVVPMSQLGPDRGTDLDLCLLAARAGFRFTGVGVGRRALTLRGEEHIDRLVAANFETLARHGDPAAVRDRVGSRKTSSRSDARVALLRSVFDAAVTAGASVPSAAHVAAEALRGRR